MSDLPKSGVYLSPAPHLSVYPTARHVMAIVVLTLLPIAGYGVYLFGLPALVTILVSVASAVACEALFRLATRQDVRVGDLSAVITGLLLALVLPPATPPAMTALGAAFGIVVAKEFFGGLGANVFNPALSGRAFLLASFATPLTTWSVPRMLAAPDAVSAATTLSYLKPAEGGVHSAFEVASLAGYSSRGELYWKMFLGERAGCVGESAIFLIVLAFAFLALARVIDWRAPVAMVLTAVAVCWAAGIDPALTVLSGGLLFGAVFMATDYATSPVTPMGRLLFGAGAGLITALVRVFGGFPEGVMFSILIMNSVVPFLDRAIPRKYGYARARKGATK
ncbi:MAG TPA: RnfABCDGE type electron transport complex subunit D [Treponemataceae bacterium]|nr:RnfABCDGE type electron transport complex subunit D [Treponemataceae bacterium]